MLKKPTTKKLSEKIVSQTVTPNKEPFHKLFSDEKFYQYPKYPHVFVSQYGNVISTHGKTPHLLSVLEDRDGYLIFEIWNKGKRKRRRLHQLVAEVWCQKPDFTLGNVPLQVHHKKKVRQASTIDVHFASNLEYVYWKYHPLVESIKSIQVQRPSGTWKYVSEIAEIAQYYNSPQYPIYKLLSKPPEKIEGNYEYYSLENIHIKIRKEVSK